MHDSGNAGLVIDRQMTAPRTTDPFGIKMLSAELSTVSTLALDSRQPSPGSQEAEGSLPADEIEQRARRADRERREAALILSSQGSRCRMCQGPVVIGATVRTVHTSACPRRITLAKARKAAASGRPIRRVAVPAPTQARTAADPVSLARKVEPTTAQQLADVTRPRTVRRWPQTAQPTVRESWPPRCRIRPKVVQAWRVDGCRVAVDGWPATVRGQIRMIGERPQARLDFDDYGTWTREDQAEIPDWWDLEDLAFGGTR